MCWFRWDEQSMPEQWVLWILRAGFAILWAIAFGYAVVYVLPTIFGGLARWRIGP